MNAQVRRLFTVVLVMFLVLASAITLVQFVNAPTLQADGRNSRTILQATERDRGPIIVSGTPVAYSERIEGTEQFQRVYSDGYLYAPVTGYFSAVNLTATGMEKATDSVLEGNSSELFMQRIRNLFAGKPRQGGGILLTLEADLQQVAAEQLGNRKGAVVVLEAKTGKVLALYSSPSYDPNPLASLDTAIAQETDFALQQDPNRPLNNRAIASDRYPPGSVFKILTAITMLENGVELDTLLDSPVTMTPAGTEITLANIDSTECGTGNVTLQEAFARSCNTTFALASQNFTNEQLAGVASRFGFGQDLKIPLSVTPSYFPETTTPAELAFSAIGQFEVAVTPMKMAQIVQTIANGGVMMQPYLVESILDVDNQVRSTTDPAIQSTPITKEIAASISQMMESVVSEPYGTGQSMALDGVRVAAKTGTAEVGDGSMADAWSVAFAPADNPQLAIAVIVEGDQADPLPHGGDVAGPIVRRLLEVGLQ